MKYIYVELWCRWTQMSFFPITKLLIAQDETCSWLRKQSTILWACLEVEPPWDWYYRISNFHILMILLQVDPAFGNELEIICEGCYKIEDTSIFAWFSIPNIEHYHWLQSSICQLPLNSKVDNFIRTIQHILNFL